jgi:hypothetical protein
LKGARFLVKLKNQSLRLEFTPSNGTFVADLNTYINEKAPGDRAGRIGRAQPFSEPVGIQGLPVVDDYEERAYLLLL